MYLLEYVNIIKIKLNKVQLDPALLTNVHLAKRFQLLIAIICAW